MEGDIERFCSDRKDEGGVEFDMRTKFWGVSGSIAAPERRNSATQAQVP